MALTDADTPRERTYGNWREPRAHGIGRFPIWATLAQIGAMAVCAVVVQRNWKLGVGILVATVVVTGPSAIRDRYGRPLGSRVAAWLSWRVAALGNRHRYVSGPLSRVPGGRTLLPGLAMNTDVYDAVDALGRPFALLHHRSVDHFVAVISCSARGGDLVDESTVDGWVGNWGDFQRRMGLEPALVGYQVVVETAPDSGEFVRRTIDSQRSPHASELACAVMEAVKAAATEGAVLEGGTKAAGGSVAIRTWVAFTYTNEHSARRRDRSIEEMAVLIGQRLPQLTEWLISTGAGASRPVRHVELAQLVRVAYEPASSAVIDRARIAPGGSGLTWSQAGPTAADPQWDRYRHDGAASCSWYLGEAPRGEIYSTVLKDMLSPHRQIDRKRVSMIYRPHRPEEAAPLVERDVRAARSGRANARGDKSRKEAEEQATRLTAREEAKGAGLTMFGLVATATVTLTGDPEIDDERLIVAKQAMDSLAAPARIMLRPAYGSQDSAFLAALPLGVILPAHHRFGVGRRS